jgi:hypothetical protein
MEKSAERVRDILRPSAETWPNFVLWRTKMGKWLKIKKDKMKKWREGRREGRSFQFLIFTFQSF